MQRTERWRQVLLLVILLLAALLRFYRLDVQSLWNDEGTTVALAQRDIPTILRNAAADIHPPLYYLGLHAWIKLAGTSEYAVRAFSALTGVLLVLVIYLLGRRILRGDIALLAALYASLSPLQVYYSQETRMYMWAALWGALSWLALIRLADADKDAPLASWRQGPAVVYFLVSTAAVYSHYVAFMVILAQSGAVVVLWLTQKGKRSLRWPMRWIGLQLLLAASYIPWLMISWRSLMDWPAVGAVLSVPQLFARAGQVFTFGVTIPQRSLVVWVGVVLISLAAVIPLITKRRAWLYTLYLFIALALFAVLSLGRPFYKDKFLLLLQPAYILLLAAATVGVGELAARVFHKRWPGWLLTAVMLGAVITTSLVSLTHLYYDPAFYRDDYRSIVAAIQRSANPNDVIMINAPSQIETVAYYHRGPQPLVPLPLTRPIDVLSTEQQLAQLSDRSARIYGIFWATNESDPDRVIETWLDQHAYKAVDQWYGALRLVVYAVPAQISAEPANATAVYFGQDIELAGYTTSTPRVRSGDIVQLALYWRALAPIGERYKVFIHLVDAHGAIAAQRDSEPGGGAALTTTWLPGEMVVDRYGILLPENTPAGEYIIRVGLYELDGGERLAATSEGNILGDYYDLGTLAVTD